MITAKARDYQSVTSDMSRCQGPVHLSPRWEPLLSRPPDNGPPGLANAAKK